ncbi:response regulator [Oscillatoria sp. FACHB-1407]|uniref:response regulator n=1 Tax=Oscillatoria sp. FACHB-1407 TaxID=2692847 RepID=UPI001F556C41|nr:response regulator [Oscillatoria sp. FACHB-1407]
MKTPTILAVDDSTIIHQLIKRALEPEYSVLVTDSPVDALSMLFHNSIAVVLLDVTMPGISGLEFCRTIRNLPQFQQLPVVMVTSRDTSFDRVQGHLAGATEYLTKPFDAEQLRQVVRKFTVSSTV